ncbi:MAG: Gfo/Idh/MocA family oxidoreductase [Planctomycetaceae bacterium]
MPPQNVTRRAFLKTGTAASLALFAPTIIPATALGRDGRAAPSERVVVGAIGSGGKGQHNLGAFVAMPDVQLVAVCDVERKHADAGAAIVNKHYGNTDCAIREDFRAVITDAEIDAVCVSTPDHWHALISVAAANAGKDVYCEKPLANSISEGRAICDAVTAGRRILQVGSHERSNPGVRFACEMARQGHLGDVKTIRIQMPTDQAHHDHVRKSLAVPPPESVPEGFDYDFWLGHTPQAPYTSGRCHFWWRFIQCYGGGEMTDRGSHIIDVAQLAAGRDDTGPVQIKASGQRNPTGLYDAFMSYEFVNTYDDGLQLIGECKGPRGLRLEGTEGALFIAVHGGKLEADPKSLLETKIEGFDLDSTNAPSHQRNFIDCVKSRSKPLADVETGQRTATICHLNNIAMRLGRELRWDPRLEQVIGDDEANSLLLPPMREPWVL